MTTSECPPKYFVQLLYTISAPKRSGDCKNGVAKVLSTTVIKLFFFPIAIATYKSISFMVGFVGV